MGHTRLRRRQHGCVSTMSKDDVLDDAAVLTPENESPRAGKNNSLLRRDALFSDAIIDSNITDDENLEFCIFSDLFLQVALLQRMLAIPVKELMTIHTRLGMWQYG